MWGNSVGARDFSPDWKHRYFGTEVPCPDNDKHQFIEPRGEAVQESVGSAVRGCAEPGLELAQGLTAVGDGIFLLGRDFGHGAVIAGGDEEGVVPEAAGAAGVQGNLPFHGADEGGKLLAVPGHGDGADIAGGEGFLAFGPGGQLGQHLAVVAFIIPVGAGVAGGVDAGHAAQGIHADAAVVRHDKAGENGGDALGLDGGVGGKGGAGFLRVRGAGEIGQGLQLELRGQDAGELTGFVRVAGGDEEGDAVGHVRFLLGEVGVFLVEDAGEEEVDDEVGEQRAENICHHLGEPDARAAPPERQQQQAGHQHQELAGDVQEHAHNRPPDALEKVADDDLGADQGEGQAHDAQAARGQGDELGGVGILLLHEGAHHGLGVELDTHPAEQREHEGGAHRIVEHAAHAAVVAYAQVIARDGLQPLRNAHHDHGYAEQHAVHDAVGPHAHGAFIAQELGVEDDNHQAAAEVHEAGRQPQQADAPHDGPAELPHVPAEVDDAAPVQKVRQHPQHAHGLPGGGGQGGAGHPPLQHPDEEVRAADVDHHGDEQAVHGLVRVAAGAHHVVQVHEREGERAGEHEHQHEIPRRAYGVLICPEKVQNLIHPRQGQPAEKHPQRKAHDGAVPQHAECPRKILLPQGDGGGGRTTQPHQGTQRHQQVHDGEQQPHAGDGISPAALAYVDGIHYVVERHGCHAHNGRQ